MTSKEGEMRHRAGRKGQPLPKPWTRAYGVTLTFTSGSMTRFETEPTRLSAMLSGLKRLLRFFSKLGLAELRDGDREENLADNVDDRLWKAVSGSGTTERRAGPHRKHADSQP